MKRKDIEKILSDEAQKLEGDFGQILARISSPRSRALSGEVQVVALTHRRRNVALACVAALLILTIVAVTLGVTLGAPAPTFGITYISIGINPALSMQVDEKDKVVSVTALNEDAQVLLLGVELVGLDYQSACLAVLTEADKEKYLEGGRDVNVSAVNDDRKREQEVRTGVENTLNGYMTQKGYKNHVFVNYFSSAAIDYANAHNISAGKAQLLLDADAVSDMTVDELSRLGYEELLFLVMGSSANASEDFQHELDERLEMLEEEFERKSEELEEKIEEIEDLFDDDDDFEDLSVSERARIKKLLLDIVRDPDVGEYFKEVIPEDEVLLDQKMRDMPAFARELEEFVGNLEERFDDLEDDFEDRLEQIKEEYHRYSRA